MHAALFEGLFPALAECEDRYEGDEGDQELAVAVSWDVLGTIGTRALIEGREVKKTTARIIPTTSNPRRPREPSHQG